MYSVCALFRVSMLVSFSIPPNLRQVVYPAGIAFGGDEEWQFLWNRYLTSFDPYEKSLCLYSLSFSREPWILNRYDFYSQHG